MDNNYQIQVPKQLSEWFGKTVIVARAPRRSLYVYMPEEFKKLENQVEQNARQHSLSYPQFYEFIRAGLQEAEISPTGTLVLPNYLYTFLGTKGEIRVRNGRLGLEIQRVYLEMCQCSDSSCRKCLMGNCKDDNCLIHSFEGKRRRRKQV